MTNSITIMKHIIASIILLLAAAIAPAQKHVYDDLLILYVDEEYSKCVEKAERYAERNDTRRDALPFLYLSKCHHEMSRLDEYTSQHEYRNADREALKYAVRFRKKDKTGEYYHHHEDYWAELNTVAMEAAINHYEAGDHTKAKRIFDRMVGYMPENPGAWRMRALCQQKARQQREAQESLKGYADAMQGIADIGRLPEDQRKLLRYALVIEAEQLIEAGEADSAREVLSIGEELFMSDAEFKAIHKALN